MTTKNGPTNDELLEALRANGMTGHLAQLNIDACYNVNEAILAALPDQVMTTDPEVHAIAITGIADGLTAFLKMHDHPYTTPLLAGAGTACDKLLRLFENELGRYEQLPENLQAITDLHLISPGPATLALNHYLSPANQKHLPTKIADQNAAIAYIKHLSAALTKAAAALREQRETRSKAVLAAKTAQATRAFEAVFSNAFDREKHTDAALQAQNNTQQ